MKPPHSISFTRLLGCMRLALYNNFLVLLMPVRRSCYATAHAVPQAGPQTCHPSKHPMCPQQRTPAIQLVEGEVQAGEGPHVCQRSGELAVQALRAEAQVNEVAIIVAAVGRCTAQQLVPADQRLLQGWAGALLLAALIKDLQSSQAPTLHHMVSLPTKADLQAKESMFKVAISALLLNGTFAALVMQRPLCSTHLHGRWRGPLEQRLGVNPPTQCAQALCARAKRYSVPPYKVLSGVENFDELN